MSTATIDATKLTRSDWLTLRRGSIGASDAAAVVGKSKRMTPLQLYADKLGLLEPSPETPEQRRGRRLEPIVLEDYQDHIGESVAAVQVFVRDESRPYMTATLDAVRHDGRPVEIKTVGPWAMREWGEEGSDHVPLHILIQVHHQLIVTGQPVADVPVLFGGETFRIYTIEADPELHEILIAKEAEFWRCVETKTPPPPVAGDEPVLARLYPRTSGEIVLDDSFQTLADRYQILGDQAKQIDDERSMVKAAMLAAMQEAATASLPDGRMLKRSVVNVAESVKKASSYIKFSIAKAKS